MSPSPTPAWPPRTLVAKFGGTSVANAYAVARCCDMVASAVSEWPRVVVVVSAMRGVTDRLLETGRAAAGSGSDERQQVLESLLTAHVAAAGPRASGLDAQLRQVLARVESDLARICAAGEATSQALDAVASAGERLSVRMVAAALHGLGVPARPIDATELIVTDDCFQEATPLQPQTCERTRAGLEAILSEGVVPVVTGFIGATADGAPTTLGRNGSDYSAALVGAAMDAEEIWLCSDVDGVMTADPRRVADARVIPDLTFDEVAELSRYGAKVVHPKTLLPVVDRDTRVWVKNTFSPEAPGSCIRRRPSDGGGPKAVTAMNTLCLFDPVDAPEAAPALIGRSLGSVAPYTGSGAARWLIPARECPAAARSRIGVGLVAVVGGSGTVRFKVEIDEALERGGVRPLGFVDEAACHSVRIVVRAEDAEEAVRQIHRKLILSDGKGE